MYKSEQISGSAYPEVAVFIILSNDFVVTEDNAFIIGTFDTSLSESLLPRCHFIGTAEICCGHDL